jgi:hypothetical protein
MMDLRRSIRSGILTIPALLLLASGVLTDAPASPRLRETSTEAQVFAPAPRLASHLFLPVGGTHPLTGLGELLEVIHFTDPPAIVIEDDALVATVGGLSCLRFMYRETQGENTVQTLCVVVFDETSPCVGLERVRLDLNAFLEAPPNLAGNANLLEAGRGLFYAACRTNEGAYRLQPSVRPLPPLYFHVVDALGSGPYSLGDDEMAAQRAGVVTTFSGETLRPSWITAVSREIYELRLTEDATITFNDEDCAVVPSCTYNSDLLQPGDILRISYGATPELFQTALFEASQSARDRFFQERIGMGWSEVSKIHPDAVGVAFARLASLEIMGQLLPYFDGLYSLREKGITIGYQPYWYAQGAVPNLCFPGEVEQASCRQIEAAIHAEEVRRIEHWQSEGYTLWYAGAVDYWEGGEYARLSNLRPHFTLFGGIAAGVGANSTFSVDDVPATLAQVMAEFAVEIGPEIPVVLYLNGPPITAQTGGPPCEADICPSDFRGTYEQIEATLDAALHHLSPEQFRGFGVALFDGAHFDIREPHEQFPGFPLNRVGETGYNNPVLNIYRTR